MKLGRARIEANLGPGRLVRVFIELGIHGLELGGSESMCFGAVHFWILTFRVLSDAMFRVHAERVGIRI